MLKFLVLAIGIVIGLSTSTIFTPLWLDSMSSSVIPVNTTGNSSTIAIDNYAVIFIVSVINLLLLSVILVSISLFGKLFKSAQVVLNSHKRDMLWVGFADAVSTVFLVYSANGSRTPPYLQALATNFAIPVTFLTRFIILRKKPSVRKATSAGLVFCAELIALIPSIFPKLENKSARKEDGGAPGLAGILWTLCYFFGFVPQAIVNVVFEKSSKSSTASKEHAVLETIHMMFWSYFFCLISLILLFWTDLIPGFGDADSIKSFWKGLRFNFECFLGATDCPDLTHLYSGITILAMLLTRLFVVLFLHFSEGANYLIIIMSLQTPLVVLFWTLFNEKPFHWNPDVHLSTWLSMASICIMLPAIYCYNKNSVEMPEENKRTESSLEEERGLLVCSTDSYQSIEASSGVVINSDSLNSNYNFAGLRRSYSPQFASSLNTEGSEVEWSFS